MKIFISIILATSILMIISCGVVPMNGVNKLDKLQLGMSKNDVKGKLGDPGEVRASYKNESDNTIETWQYTLRKISSGQAVGNVAFGIFYTITWWFPLFKEDTDYWVHFKDGALLQWSRSGDLQLDKDIRVRIKHE
jgi:hypothetical protein